MLDRQGVAWPFDRVFVVIAAASIAVSIAGPPAVAQVDYKWGWATAETPRQVALDSLSPYGLPAGRAAARPGGGFSTEGRRSYEIAAAVSAMRHPDAAPLALPADVGKLASPPAALFDGNRQSKCSIGGASDMGLAVGDDSSTHPVLQVNNFCISLFTRNGMLRSGYPKRLDSLFPSVGIIDPRAIYDWANQRYVIISTDVDDNGKDPGYYWIAVSAGNVSAALYYVYRLPIPSGNQGVFADFPRIGQDRDTIYLASNKFSYEANGRKKFQYEEVLLLPKWALYQGSNFHYRYAYDIRYREVQDGRTVEIVSDTSQPANVWNPDENPPAGLFVSSKNIIAGGGGYRCEGRPCNGLFVWAISNPSLVASNAGPVISGMAIPTRYDYVKPPVVQQGSSTYKLKVDAGDNRISGQVNYSGIWLHASLTTANRTGGASAILYRIEPTLRYVDDQRCYPQQCSVLSTARIYNEAFLNYPNGNSSFYATIQPDTEGNTLTVFNLAGPDYFPSTAYLMRNASGDFENSGVIVRQGRSAYGPAERAWGDYTAVAPMLQRQRGQPSSMWFSGEYTGAPTEHDNSFEWLTVVGNTRYSPTARR